MTWVPSPLSLNVVRISYFELMLGTGQTDGRTEYNA